MAENVTGNCQQGSYRREIIISNVLWRVQAKKAESLDKYLQEAISNDQEFAQLLSAFTIHTTEWFREMPHYKKFETLLTERFKGTKDFGCNLEVVQQEKRFILLSCFRSFSQCASWF